jgi:serine/threonine-protein kinase
MLIGDRYQIDTELGAGAMGTVYKGVDTTTQKVVAIKHLKPELTDLDMIERFKREGEALRALNHPNIVTMLDAVQAGDDYYLVMEYLPGGDLSTLLQKRRPAISQVLKLAIDIADALTRAHRLNIIHRDLKPANVLLAEDGTPRLTDFGVAHVGGKERVTVVDAIIGTIY